MSATTRDDAISAEEMRDRLERAERHLAQERARNATLDARLESAHEDYEEHLSRVHEAEHEAERLRRDLADERAAAGTSGGTTPAPTGGKVTIDVSEIDGGIHKTVDAAIRALAKLQIVYTRAGGLVHVVRDPGAADADATGLVRRRGAPIVVPLSRSRLRELLDLAAGWRTCRDRAWVPAAPPAWVVDTILDRGEWPALPALEGLIDVPTLRADGTVLDVEGYDASTRLIYSPGSTKYPAVPTTPTREDAVAALAELAEPFCDFVFVAESDRAAAIALVLSLVGRAAIAGQVPMFGAGAPTPGSGKGLLIDVAAIIATGREAPKMMPAPEDETRKRLLAIALAADPLVCLDNVVELGSPVLAGALTSGKISDRILGASRQVTASLRAVWCFTGNNVVLRGDLGRRVVPIGLDPRVEHPEDRTGFRYPDLKSYVRAERPRLVVAALAILRAYCVAGRPAHGMPAKGSFESWDSLVRGALVWAGAADPLGGVHRIRESDDGDLGSLAAVLLAWRESYREPVTAARVVADLAMGLHADLKAAIEGVVDARKGISAASVGFALRGFKDRVCEGVVFRAAKDRKKVTVWAVAPADQAG